MVSDPPLELKVPGSTPDVGMGLSVSEHSFLRVICRDDMQTVRRTSDRGINWSPHPLLLQGQSPVQVKEPYGNSKWLLVGLHPATGIRLECLRGRTAVYWERKKHSYCISSMPVQTISWKLCTFLLFGYPFLFCFVFCLFVCFFFLFLFFYKMKASFKSCNNNKTGENTSNNQYRLPNSLLISFQ